MTQSLSGLYIQLQLYLERITQERFYELVRGFIMVHILLLNFLKNFLEIIISSTYWNLCLLSIHNMFITTYGKKTSTLITSEPNTIN